MWSSFGIGYIQLYWYRPKIRANIGRRYGPILAEDTGQYWPKIWANIGRRYGPISAEDMGQYRPKIWPNIGRRYGPISADDMGTGPYGPILSDK